jgi:ABC-type Zn uptake system ZnuABC Zn-binding protein ZnuA
MAETIGREAGVSVVVARTPSMATPSDRRADGDSYLEMIRHNTATIVGNLSGA